LLGSNYFTGLEVESELGTEVVVVIIIIIIIILSWLYGILLE
jgi:hypothetical protein